MQELTNKEELKTFCNESGGKITEEGCTIPSNVSVSLIYPDRQLYNEIGIRKLKRININSIGKSSLDILDKNDFIVTSEQSPINMSINRTVYEKQFIKEHPYQEFKDIAEGSKLLRNWYEFNVSIKKDDDRKIRFVNFKDIPTKNKELDKYKRLIDDVGGIDKLKKPNNSSLKKKEFKDFLQHLGGLYRKQKIIEGYHGI